MSNPNEAANALEAMALSAFLASEAFGSNFTRRKAKLELNKKQKKARNKAKLSRKSRKQHHP